MRTLLRPVAAAVLTAALVMSAGAVAAAPSTGSNTSDGAFTEGATSPTRARAVGVVDSITSPTQIPDRCHPYGFAGDAEGSTPSTFRNGTLDGGGLVVVVGSSWGTWNPQTNGKHLLFASDGVERITFNKSTRAAMVKAEPNNFDLYDITMTAYDKFGHPLGSATREIHGFAGAAYLGLLSDTAVIKSVRVVSEAAAGGFGFSDINWSGSTCVRPR